MLPLFPAPALALAANPAANPAAPQSPIRAQLLRRCVPRPMPLLLFLAPAAALVIAQPAAPQPAAPAPSFDAIAFFTGRTEGAGRLKIAMRAARPVAVHGSGAVDPDGTLVLTQLVEEGGGPPRRREWRVRRTAPGRYAGTLTDAIGPVAGVATGDRLRLTYRMPGGLAAEQWLTLAADGRSARNVLTVRKLGVVVARLAETIVRPDG